MIMGLQSIKSAIDQELTDNILKYWLNYAPDKLQGGYVGEVNNENVVKHSADKGCVLNTRILWSFAAAYNHYHEKRYLQEAERAFHYIMDHFYDHVKGGLFWLINSKGTPIDKRKQIYANAFGIYAFAEYYKASGDERALQEAVSLFGIIEMKSLDRSKGGYFEAFNEDWSPIADMRLSAKDMNTSKTFNTHLHILEAYTNLMKVWKSDQLKTALKDLTELILSRFYDDQTGHFHLFFDDNWKLKSHEISFGHDIEAAWLITEAVQRLQDHTLMKRMTTMAEQVAQATLNEGIDSDGSIYYEKKKRLDTDRHWWPQAEAMVGFMNAYQITGEEKYLNAIDKLWSFIRNHLIMPNGEWYWSVDENYTPHLHIPKVNMWKGPYHNARACIEMINRINEINKQIIN